jgi:hypothetical protein
MRRTTKGERLAAVSALEQRVVTDADQPHEIRAGALHEAQIARVIDHLRKVGVFEVDANRQDVAEIGQAAGQVRPIVGGDRHFHPAFQRFAGMLTGLRTP